MKKKTKKPVKKKKGKAMHAPLDSREPIAFYAGCAQRATRGGAGALLALPVSYPWEAHPKGTL